MDIDLPVVADFVLTENNQSNDMADVIRLGSNEAGVESGKLKTRAQVMVEGVVENTRVDIFSDYSSTDTSVGWATVNGSGVADIDLSLSEGAQTLSVRVLDSAGNRNDAGVSPTLDVDVDITPGTVNLALASQHPYTSLHGTIADKGTGITSDDQLLIPVNILVTDNRSLEGATLNLVAWDAPSGGSLIEGSSSSHLLAAGEGSVDLNDFALRAGLSYLEATLTDPFGNVQVGKRLLYAADFYGPTVILKVIDGAGSDVTTPSCDSFQNICVADVLQQGSDSRAYFDSEASSAWCPGGTYPCNTAGTDIALTLSNSINSDDSLEGSIASIEVQSRVVSDTDQGGATDTRLFSRVFGASGTSGEVDAVSLASIFDPDLSVDPGLKREFRMIALDTNGNKSYSNSVFLELSLDGVLILLEQLDTAAPPQASSIYIDEGHFFGSSVNASASGFATNLRVHIESVSGEVATDVRLDVTNDSGTTSYSAVSILGGVADFEGVVMNPAADPASPDYHSFVFTVGCGASGECGNRQYDSLVADIKGPTYEFDRWSLCCLNVPLVGEDDSLCSACDCSSGSTRVCGDALVDNADANIDTAKMARWNIAADQDSAAENGFTLSTTPLRLRVKDVAAGQFVTLSSNRGGVSESSDVKCDAGKCYVDFAFSAPTLVGTLEHQLSVTFSDQAGNDAAPETLRGSVADETIYALVDTIAPAANKPVVCIGESTTPYSAASAENDLETFEASECASLCTGPDDCSRLLGNATLQWVAPADDGSEGSAVVGYSLVVAALGIPYDLGDGETQTFSSCAELTLDGPSEISENFSDSALPGATATKVVSGLYPHRSYCFLLVGLDDLGNMPVFS
ncbi:hypothetical protein KAI87_14135, partial [Myxococcota bacterium]|nr:hypothetical protein [Myxococcota bacterium]